MSDRLFRQLQAFDSIAMTCDRCERDVPLSYLEPCADLTYGFICKVCLKTMPVTELLRLNDSAP